MKQFPFKPTNTNIIIRPDTEAEKSAGGIIIPDAAKRPLTQGTVLKVGDNVQEIKVGYSVIFGLHTDSTIRIDGESFSVVTEENILAYMPDEKAAKPKPGTKIPADNNGDFYIKK